MTDLDRGLLRTYLADHLAGATGGAARFRRMADAYADTPLGPDLRRIADEVTTEREWLIETAHRLDVQPSMTKRVLVAVGERVGRLKPNGRVAQASPLSAVLELDIMRGAVVGKRGLWETLELWADELGLERAPLQRLIEQADEQAGTLTRLGGLARRRAFVAHGGPPRSGTPAPAHEQPGPAS